MFEIGIIGSTGLLGKAITKVVTRNTPGSVVEFTRSRNLSYSQEHRNLALLDILKLEKSLKSLRGLETIIFCNGFGGIDYASEEATHYFKSEKNLIEKLLELDKRVIYFSSNKVELFQSRSEVVLSPRLHQYLQHKLSMEEILSKHPNQTVIRLGKVIHDQYPRYKSWIEDCTKFQSLQVPKNVYYEPIDINFVSDEVFKIYTKGSSGFFIMQSSDAISYFASAFILLQTFFKSSMYNHLVEAVELDTPLPSVRIDSLYPSRDFMIIEGFTCTKNIEMVARRMRRATYSLLPSFLKDQN